MPCCFTTVPPVISLVEEPNGQRDFLVGVGPRSSRLSLCGEERERTSEPARNKQDPERTMKRTILSVAVLALMLFSAASAKAQPSTCGKKPCAKKSCVKKPCAKKSCVKKPCGKKSCGKKPCIKKPCGKKTMR
jgi:hypothetical protein